MHGVLAASTVDVLSVRDLPDNAVSYAEPKAIAEQGFQFLLLDTYSQLWLLLQQYIANAQKKAGVHQLCHA